MIEIDHYDYIGITREEGIELPVQPPQYHCFVTGKPCFEDAQDWDLIDKHRDCNDVTEGQLALHHDAIRDTGTYRSLRLAHSSLRASVMRALRELNNGNTDTARAILEVAKDAHTA